MKVDVLKSILDMEIGSDFVPHVCCKLLEISSPTDEAYQIVSRFDMTSFDYCDDASGQLSQLVQFMLSLCKTLDVALVRDLPSLIGAGIVDTPTISCSTGIAWIAPRAL